MPEKVVLKKYANRRLYDTEKRAFVSLAQIAELVKQGREIEISDDKTGEDVTAFILTQIVLEEAKKENPAAPGLPAVSAHSLRGQRLKRIL